LFDEWWKAKRGEPVESIARHGTVDWLFREYKKSIRIPTSSPGSGARNSQARRKTSPPWTSPNQKKAAS
jgi:hypothetical protein